MLFFDFRELSFSLLRSHHQSLLLVDGTADDGGDGGEESDGQRNGNLPSDELVTVGLIGGDLSRGLAVINNVGGNGLGEQGDDGGAKEELNPEALAAGEGALTSAVLLGGLRSLLEHTIAALDTRLKEDQGGEEGSADAGVGVDGGAAEEIEEDGHLHASLLAGNGLVHLVGVVEAADDEAKAEGVDGNTDGALGEAEEGVLGGGGGHGCLENGGEN